jgi:hypothetical protein
MNNSALEMGCQCEECDRRLVLKLEISMSAVGGRGKSKEEHSGSRRPLRPLSARSAV